MLYDLHSTVFLHSVEQVGKRVFAFAILLVQLNGGSPFFLFAAALRPQVYFNQLKTRHLVVSEHLNMSHTGLIVEEYL